MMIINELKIKPNSKIIIKCPKVKELPIFNIFHKTFRFFNWDIEIRIMRNIKKLLIYVANIEKTIRDVLGRNNANIK